MSTAHRRKATARRRLNSGSRPASSNVSSSSSSSRPPVCATCAFLGHNQQQVHNTAARNWCLPAPPNTKVTQTNSSDTDAVGATPTNTKQAVDDSYMYAAAGDRRSASKATPQQAVVPDLISSASGDLVHVALELAASQMNTAEPTPAAASTYVAHPHTDTTEQPMRQVWLEVALCVVQLFWFAYDTARQWLLAPFDTQQVTAAACLVVFGMTYKALQAVQLYSHTQDCIAQCLHATPRA